MRDFTQPDPWTLREWVSYLVAFVCCVIAIGILGQLLWRLFF